MPAPRIENVRVFRKGWDVTDEEWVADVLARCDPLTQRQLDIITFEFRKSASEAEVDAEDARLAS